MRIVKYLTKSQIEMWNQQIRSGQDLLVSDEIAALPHSKIPIELLASFANLSWRVHRPHLGLKAVRQILEVDEELKTKSHPDIYAEYAGCLLEVGARAEAKLILSSLLEDYPRAQFYLAWLCIKEWDYQAATKYFQEYLQRGIKDEYHRLVVQVNLASSLVTNENFDGAHKVLKEVKPKLRGDFALLLGNCYEIESQIYFDHQDYEVALVLLEKSSQLLSKSKGAGWLFCKKWQHINQEFLNLRKNGLHKDGLQKWDELRLQAIEMKDWETLRELDLFQGLVRSDHRLINRAYFGTPHLKYRERVNNLISRYQPDLPLDKTYLLKGSLRAPDVPTVQLDRILSDDGDEDSGFLVLRCLYVLALDFYANQRPGHLFAELYPRTYYSPNTSPRRVFQIINRTRKLIEQVLPGSIIEFEDGGYKLKLSENSSLLIPIKCLTDNFIDRNDKHLKQLASYFRDAEFTAIQLSEKMNWSRRTANRNIRQLIDEGKVVSIGKGSKTRFRIAG